MTWFRDATGRRVVSRDDAESHGELSSFVVDAGARKIVALVVGSGRKAVAFDWDQVSGFGPDAILVEGPPAGDEAQTKDAASGRNDPMGKRLLTVLGEEVGTVVDVDFDPDSAEVQALRSDQGADVPADRLRGVGSYAVVVDVAEDA